MRDETVFNVGMEIIEPDTPSNRDRIVALLAKYPAMSRYVANVIPDPRCADLPFVDWPTVAIFGNGVIELTWCNLAASFSTAHGDLISDEHDWTDVDPAGRLMACV